MGYSIAVEKKDKKTLPIIRCIILILLLNAFKDFSKDVKSDML